MQGTLSEMQENGWHHLFSIQNLFWSQMKGCSAIILSPLQMYFRDFKGRTLLEIKYLWRSKERNIPKGQMSVIRYQILATAVTYIQTTYLCVPRQQLYQCMQSRAFTQYLNKLVEATFTGPVN